MESNSETNVKKVRRLTDRQKVKSCFPEAYLRYVRQRRDGKHYLVKLDSFDILSVAPTAREAWQGAWRCTQVRMAKKLGAIV